MPLWIGCDPVVWRNSARSLDVFFIPRHKITTHNLGSRRIQSVSPAQKLRRSDGQRFTQECCIYGMLLNGGGVKNKVGQTLPFCPVTQLAPQSTSHFNKREGRHMDGHASSHGVAKKQAARCAARVAWVLSCHSDARIYGYGAHALSSRLRPLLKCSSAHGRSDRAVSRPSLYRPRQNRQPVS
jgi:hypothetical protein